jgi:phosphatidylserine/phosphatidylglycerophosphate/cardiolipin synthase-like enzyme
MLRKARTGASLLAGVTVIAAAATLTGWVPAVAVWDATALAVGAEAPTAAVGTDAPTAIWPLIGRETPCVYCDVAAAAFGEASASIDVLLSSLDAEDDPVVDALVGASARGVPVRVLLDQSDFEPSITERNARAVAFLVSQGIDARLDDAATTTHAKLAIVDRATVFVGSTNWNHYALFEHRQADVRIDDERVGAAFGDFFERLWANPSAPLGLTFDHVEVPLDGPTLVALPDAGQSTLYGSFVLDLLAHATTSVHAALYRVSVYPQFKDSATSALVDGLIQAAGRGLEVRVLMDDCSFYADSAEANLESAIFLYQNGLDVRLDDPDVTTHAKLLVVDGETVVLGSTNWNYYSVERNIEANVALVRMPDVASVFESYFASLWAEGRPIAP